VLSHARAAHIFASHASTAACRNLVWQAIPPRLSSLRLAHQGSRGTLGQRPGKTHGVERHAPAFFFFVINNGGRVHIDLFK